jgi:hypothetical protein
MLSDAGLAFDAVKPEIDERAARRRCARAVQRRPMSPSCLPRPRPSMSASDIPALSCSDAIRPCR